MLWLAGEPYKRRISRLWQTDKQTNWSDKLLNCLLSQLKMLLLLLKCESTFVWCILWWGLKDIRCLRQHIPGRRGHKSATENISFQVTMVRLQWSLSRYNGQWSLGSGPVWRGCGDRSGVKQAPGLTRNLLQWNVRKENVHELPPSL